MGGGEMNCRVCGKPEAVFGTVSTRRSMFGMGISGLTKSASCVQCGLVNTLAPYERTVQYE